MLDTLRRTLYIAQPDSNRVLRLSLATMTFGMPITLGGRPTGLDLSLGGDTLLVALFGTQELAFVNLQTNAVKRVAIVGLPTAAGAVGPTFLREASNRKILISLHYLEYDGWDVWEYDLATGRQRARPEATRASGYDGPIVRIGTPSRLIRSHQIYTAATDSFSDQVPFGPYALPSADSNGRNILISYQLSSPSLMPVRTLIYGLWGSLGPSALSYDGSVAYFGTHYGVRVVRPSDGAIVQDFPVAELPISDQVFTQLIPMPGGKSLIGIGHYQIARIELQ
jgi:hypothetical protein